MRFGKVNKEDDFYLLNAVNVVAKLAGLTRKYKGALVLTKKGKSASPQEAYQFLFEAFAKKFNWAYGDGYPEVYTIQMAAFYSIYLIQKNGRKWISPNVLIEGIVHAFPHIMKDPELIDSYFGVMDTLTSCYSLRTLDRFLRFFGLIETQHQKQGMVTRISKIKATPLLSEIVVFQLNGISSKDTDSSIH
jgi:hypothetical protein